MDKFVEYSIDPTDSHDDGVVLGEKEGTVADRNAMTRLGKEQLFKVSCEKSLHKGLQLTLSVEEF